MKTVKVEFEGAEVSSGGTGISSGHSAAIAALAALQVDALITEAMNAAFDCGAWDDDERPEAYTPLAEKACAAKEKLKAAVEALLSTQPAAPKQEPVDLGPWRYSFEDGRHFVESYDFTHDVRLYIDGDFAHAEDREAYGEMLAKRLNGAASGNTPYDEGPFTLDAQAAPALPEGDALRLLRAVVAELDEDAPDAPGHCHAVHGKWDKDGSHCDWCTTWADVRSFAAAPKPDA